MTRVQVVNLDQPGPQYSFSFGQMLVGFLQDERLANLLQVTEAADEASARVAVDSQDAGVAVIIPPHFTTAALAPAGSASIMLYQDPTLTLGPGIVKGIVSQFVDGFAGTKIAGGVVADQLGQRGVAVDASLMQDVAMQYGAWVEALGESWGEEVHPALDIQPPPSKAEPASQEAIIFGAIMAGMVIFFAFSPVPAWRRRLSARTKREPWRGSSPLPRRERPSWAASLPLASSPSSSRWSF